MRKPKGRYHHGALREAAIEAAAQEIDAHGHVGFTVERVAKRVGVTVAALYRHFASRDALLREVMWRTFERFVETVDAAATAPGASDPIAAIGVAFVRFARDNPGWFRLQFSRAGGALSDRQAKSHPRYADVIRAELETLFGDDASTIQSWFLTLWALIQGAATMCVEHVPPAPLTDEERLGLADQQIVTFLGAMRSSATKRRRREATKHAGPKRRRKSRGAG